MKVSGFDRALMSVFPTWGLNRVKARAALELVQRHFEAAEPGRRTEKWRRDGRDADLTRLGATKVLRENSRDLLRNNGWARRAQSVITGNVVGTGIMAKATGPNADVANDLWKRWAMTTECESDNRAPFGAIQAQCVDSCFPDGEVFLRRRWRRPSDRLTVPMQIQVLEADYLNTAWNFLTSESGGPIIQGIEFDGKGRRTGYYMWKNHPGSGRNSETPDFVPASEIIHIYDVQRAGSNFGVSWLAAAILSLKDLDDFEDAELMRHKIAACFAAFTTDVNGTGAPILDTDDDGDGDEMIEPGAILSLEPGRDVKFPTPPTITDTKLSERTLRKIAGALKGVTYEDLTGDYSQVNFSSGRMGRLATRPQIERWQEHMMIPLACQGVWDWCMEAAQTAGLLPEDEPLPGATWTSPPMQMIEPDKETLGTVRQVRGGLKSLSKAIREQGEDPDEVFAELAADMKKAKALGLVLDTDPSKTTQSGQEQPSETAINSPDDPAPAADP